MSNVLELAELQLENEGVFEWFDRAYYLDKLFEYTDKIVKYQDRLKVYEKYNQKRKGVI